MFVMAPLSQLCFFFLFWKSCRVTEFPLLGRKLLESFSFPLCWWSWNWMVHLSWHYNKHLLSVDADRDCPIFTANHHLYGPPMISEISTSRVIFHGHEPIHRAVFTPMCGNFIGANQPFVASAAQRAAQYGAGGLRNFVSVGHRAILQPR